MTSTDKQIHEFLGIGRHHDNLPLVPKRATREDLATLFGKLGYRTGVEVGTKRGDYATVLLDANPSLHLTCVDPWSLWAPNARQDAEYAKSSGRLAGRNAEILRHKSLDAVEVFEDTSLDFVYIDGAHDFDNVMRDIIEWSAKVRPGGIVACHDFFHFRRGGVVMAVEAYTRGHRIDPWYATREEMPTAFWVKR